VSDLKLVVVNGLFEAAVKQLHATTQRTLQTYTPPHSSSSPVCTSSIMWHLPCYLNTDQQQKILVLLLICSGTLTSCHGREKYRKYYHSKIIPVQSCEPAPA